MSAEDVFVAGYIPLNIAIKVNENYPAVIERAATGCRCVHRVGARTNRYVLLGTGRLGAPEIKARVQIIGGTGDAAVLRKHAEIRDANTQDDADYNHRDEQLIQREAALVSIGHTGNIRMILARFISIRSTARSGR